jgi:hypothetical protein
MMMVVLVVSSSGWQRCMWLLLWLAAAGPANQGLLLVTAP